MLHVALNNKTIIEVEDIEQATRRVVDHVTSNNLRPSLFVFGQVFDDDGNLIGVIGHNGELFTKNINPGADGFWELNQLAVKVLLQND